MGLIGRVTLCLFIATFLLALGQLTGVALAGPQTGVSCSASTCTLDQFDDVSSLSDVTDYDANATITTNDGVACPSAPAGSPHDCVDADALSGTHSPPNAVASGCAAPEENECDDSLTVQFADTTNYVSMYAGGGGVNTDKVTLIAYDQDHNVITTSTESDTQTVSGFISVSSGSTPTIAYVVLSMDTDRPNGTLGMDDLEYGTAAPPPPQSWQIGAITESPQTLFQGGTMTVTVQILRYNLEGATPIDVCVDAGTGLPTGVSADRGTCTSAVGQTATITLHAASNAPAEAGAQVQIVGTDQGDTEHEKAVGVTVGTALTLTADQPSLALTPCTPESLGITVNSNVGTPTVTGAITPSPSGSSQPTISFAAGGGLPYTGTFTVTGAAQGELPAGSALQITAAAGGYERTVSVPLTFQAPAITSVFAQGGGNVQGVGQTPQGRQNFETIVSGHGFCPGATVEFGNAGAITPADSINGHGAAQAGTEIVVDSTPRLATTGTITVTNPGGQQATSPQPVYYDSYRNTFGFAFGNFDPSIDFDTITAAFGAYQTYDQIPACLFGCVVSVEDPVAAIVDAIAKNTIASAGACFGFSLASERFADDWPAPGFGAGDPDLSNYPHGAPSAPDGLLRPFDLSGANGPSPQIADYLATLAVEQFSDQFITAYLEESVGNEHDPNVVQDVRTQVLGELNKGVHPMIALRDHDHLTDGHIVTAYDLQDSGPGLDPASTANPHPVYAIDVYDSNDPFTATEDSNVSGATHNNAVQRSRIIVSSDGSWILQSTGGDDGQPFNGQAGGLVVVDPGSTPVGPALPGSSTLNALAMDGSDLLFGSTGSSSAPSGGPAPSQTTQISDGHGRDLFTPAGALNSDPKTGLDATPFAPLVSTSRHSGPEMFLISPKAGDVTQTIKGTRSGRQTHIEIGPGFAATVDSRSAPGVSDQLGLLSGGIAFTSGGRTPLTLQVIGRDGTHVTRVASLQTTSAKGDADELAFNSARSIVSVVHHGSAVTIRLRLSSWTTGPKGSAPVEFESAPLRVTNGEKVSFKPLKWSSLTAVRMSARGHAKRLHDVLAPSGLVRGVKLVAPHIKHGHSVVLTLHFKLRALPAGSSVDVVLQALSGRRTVGTRNLVLTGAGARGGSHTETLSLAKPPAGRYRFKASVAALVSSGALRASQAKSVTAGFTVR